MEVSACVSQLERGRLSTLCESGRLVSERVSVPSTVCVNKLEVSESVSLPSTACYCVCERDRVRVSV